ncbi:MAG TPA: hypothetical protein VFX42_07925 [Gemmatimonadales bacterium]|nr:hypothetical protein [Gemmatimonadales bacterium]
MRYLLFAALTLAACERRNPGRDVATTDTTLLSDTVSSSATPPAQTMSAVPDRLIGMWTAKGYDAGSSRAQPFTITWTRAPDGSLAGIIAFQNGEKYNVKVVSTGDSTIVYESEPHQSPTLKTQVVTRTQARLVGDTLKGTYEAKGKGGKVLRGEFTATRGSGS